MRILIQEETKNEDYDCIVCKDRGFKMIGGKPIICPVCKGKRIYKTKVSPNKIK